MAKINMTAEQRTNLESLLEQGYQELKKYVESPKSTQISTVNMSYHSAYRLLAETCSSATHSFRYLRKGGERAKEIEGFIYQAVLMVNPPSMKSNVPPFHVEEDSNDGMGGLKAYIDAAEPNSSGPRGTLFRGTQIKAEELRGADKYAELLNAMGYIRNLYQTGTILGKSP